MLHNPALQQPGGGIVSGAKFSHLRGAWVGGESDHATVAARPWGYGADAILLVLAAGVKMFL